MLAGRYLIDNLVERLESCGAFGPIYVAGPAPVYSRAENPLRLIDTDRSFGENIQIALETVINECPGQHVAFITCDVLPDLGELSELLDDYWSAVPLDLWFPLILTEGTGNLGASDWKPRYRVVPEPGKTACSILPGHLAIVDPTSLRLAFLYRLFDLAYSTRNRPIRYRRSYILRHVLWSLVRQDFLHITSGRLPTLTWDVVRSGVRAADRLRRGVITREELEDALRQMFVRRRHRKRHPQRRTYLPLKNALSIARDIDTVEEAQALGATLSKA